MKATIAILAVAVCFCGCSLATPGKSHCDACLDGGPDFVSSDAEPVAETDALKQDVSIPKCVDNDKDGYCSDVDCDDTTGDVYPNNVETCDGRDNDCNGRIDENLIDVGGYCGPSVGECKPGSDVCAGGYLECAGAILPKNEICDGKDNDCDGKTDEDFADLGKDCKAGVGECAADGYLVCSGSATELVCDAAPAPPQMEGPPGSASCGDTKDNDCDGLTDISDPDCKQCAADIACDDANPCTLDKCLGGVCKNTAYADGTACADGQSCNGAETCQSGKCVAGPKVFCDDGDQCTTDVCDEAQKKCVFRAISVSGKEGLPGSPECLDGQDNDCDGLTDLSDPDCVNCGTDLECIDDNPCTNDVCNSQKVCVNSPKTNGAPCSDGFYCNGMETCQSGTCQPGTAIACNDNNTCTSDSCSETLLGLCVYAPVQGCKSCVAASDCDDGNDCTADVCTADKCYNTAKADNAVCEDGAFCTVNKKCLSGTCVGTPRDCSSYGDVCNTGVCDESADMCKKSPKSDSTLCDDGQWCTVNDHCSSGNCVSGGQRNCGSGYNCNESQDQCAYQQCQSNGDCNDGNSCTQDVCNQTTWKCERFDANGVSCDDGQWCTIGDYCSSGYCVSGGQRNCNPGTCNETYDRCDMPNNGPGCSDGTREGFVDSSIFPNIAGCSGTWSTPGLTNANYLCASGWHICNGASDVSSRLPFGKTCQDAWSGSEKRFFATFQSSGGFGYCNTPGTNDVFGCGNYGDPPASGGSCNPLNVFSSEDCSAIKYPYSGAPETWQCGGAGDSSNELITIVKLQAIGGGALCCSN